MALPSPQGLVDAFMWQRGHSKAGMGDAEPGHFLGEYKSLQLLLPVVQLASRLSGGLLQGLFVRSAGVLHPLAAIWIGTYWDLQFGLYRQGYSEGYLI